MHFKDILIALLVIFFWSMSLIVQKIFCQTIPLEFFNLLRFAFCIPCLFFLKKPSVALHKLLLVAIFWNVMCFFLIGMSLQYGTGVGLISVIYQTSSFFGVFFCFAFIKEIPKIHQIVGMVLSFSGVVLLFNNSIAHSNQTLLGLLFILFAAISWGVGITLIKKYKLSCDLSTNAWLASLSAIPMLLLNLVHRGLDETLITFNALSPMIVAGILFTACGPTLLAGCIWFWLLKKYPSSLVTPYMLLLPALSCITSYLIFDEVFTQLQIFAFGIIFLGVSINQNLHRNTHIISLIPGFGWKRWISTN